VHIHTAQITQGEKMLRFLSPLVLMLGCNSFSPETELNAEEELFMKTISAEEDNLVQDVEDEMEGPNLFRECNRGSFFEKAFERYDSNADRELQQAESDQVLEERPERKRHKMKRMRKMMDLLLWVYDIDQDGSISETERQDLFADFDERCENMHARLLAEFDLDGDGELSDEEKEAVRAMMEEKRSEHRAKREENRENREENGEREQGLFAGDQLPKFAQEFDLDENGEISDTELETLRQTMRERIRSGEKFGQCNKDDAEEELDESEQETEEIEESSETEEESTEM